MPKFTFNFTRITIKIGRNGLPDPVASQFFEGCLSNFNFQGTGIIITIFRQYPLNTNPIRGKETVNKNGQGFSNVSEPCDDFMTTTGPIKTTAPSTTEHQRSTTLSSTKQSDVTTPSGTYSTSTTPSSNSNKNQIAIGTLFFSTWLPFMIKTYCDVMCKTKCDGFIYQTQINLSYSYYIAVDHPINTFKHFPSIPRPELLNIIKAQRSFSVLKR